ncbi:MAG: DUF5067 domain-containing protein [Oscillospiraceae bacterium]|nr:DUF5067 domain-containing protein [Oscillospiraceae bacterium]
MAFCTECGSKLPDDAVFCPNCGKSMASATQKEKVPTNEINQVTQNAVENSSPTVDEVPSAPAEFQNSGVYVAPTQMAYSAPVQGAYTPSEQSSYSPPQSSFTPTPPTYQGGYAPQPQSQYYQPNAYGYPPYPGAPNSMPLKKSGGKTALIVILSVVAVIIIAVILILTLGKDPYVGYWESVSVDIGEGITEDYYGTSIVGSLGIQINSDGSAYLASSYSTEVYEGTWEKTDDGLEIEANDETHSFEYEDHQLIMTEEGEAFYFEQVDGDINNPSIPHGSVAETSSDNITGNVAGSGYLEESSFYVSVIGSEDFTDIDGDSAIRIFYEFTNYDDDTFSMSARDAVAYYAMQDGSELTETYTADELNVTDNQYYRIRQGLTMQCCAEFKYDPYGGSVDFNLYSSYEGDSAGVVTASYLPSSLPGAPAPYVISPITNPQWTINLSTEGQLDDYYVAVTGSEWVTDYDGYQAIRVYYEFTNNSSSDICMSDALWVDSYQDGISLDYTYASEESQSDNDFYTSIAPGQTITASCVFLIRNMTSPLEAEVEADYEYAAVGQMFDVAG